MKLKTLIILTLFSVLCKTGNAQAIVLKTPAEAKEVSLKVVTDFKEYKIAEAFELIKLYWPLPENEQDAVKEKTIKNLNLVRERFGKPEAVTKISEQTIKDFALKETYFVRYQNTAIRVMFVYYKNEKGWMLNSFKFDDNFIEEFK